MSGRAPGSRRGPGGGLVAQLVEWERWERRQEEKREVLRVRCACGRETGGPEDTVVESTQEHGRRAHDTLATREQILEMAIDSKERPRPAT